MQRTKREKLWFLCASPPTHTTEAAKVHKPAVASNHKCAKNITIIVIIPSWQVARPASLSSQVQEYEFTESSLRAETCVPIKIAILICHFIQHLIPMGRYWYNIAHGSRNTSDMLKLVCQTLMKRKQHF